MSLNIQTSTGLLEISTKVTKDKVISALGYEPADKAHIEDKTVHVTSAERESWNNKSDVKHYEDLEGAPSIAENDSGSMVIADENGNIIMQVDADGLATTNVSAKTINLDGEDLGVRLDELEDAQISGIVENESGKVEFTDETGNVIARINADGFETTTVTAESAVINGVDIGTKLDEHKEEIDSVSKDLSVHTTNSTVHITNDDRTLWDNKSDFSGDYNDLINAPDIKEDSSGEVVYADEQGNVIAKIGESGFETTQVIANSVLINGANVGSHVGNTDIHITADERKSWNAKADKVYVDEAVANLVNSAPETLDTLNELAAALGDDPNFATTVATQIGLKADQTDLVTHTSDKDIHITADERTSWNAKSNFSGDYNDLTNAPSIADDNSGSVVYTDEQGNIIAKIDANGFETTAITAKSIVVNGIDVEDSLDGKADSNHTHSQYLTANDIVNKADKSYVNNEIDAAIDEAKADASNKDAAVLVESQKSINDVKTSLNNHTGNDDIHITNDERTSWNNKLEASDIANKADKSELHNHSNKAELDKIANGKVAYWDAKSEFSGDYNDLENAPNIYEDGSDNLVIADQNGNIIFRSDAGGFETTTLAAQTIVVNGTDIETALEEKADKTYVDEEIESAINESAEEVKIYAANNDTVVLLEAQKNTDAAIEAFKNDLPVAEPDKLGCIKVGNGFSMNNGVLSLTQESKHDIGIMRGSDEPSGEPETGEGTIYIRTGGDAVVEVGTSGMWTYRKWASGIAECWCNHTCTDVKVTSSWGSLYESSGYALCDYPFEFAEVPTQTINVIKTGGSAFFIYQYDDSGNTTSSAGTVYFYRPTSSTSGQDVVLSIQVIGRWKLGGAN